MGACFSSWMNLDSDEDVKLLSSSANVITINGKLRQFPIPLTVSQLLQQIESGAGSESSFFVCNSDSLYYDEHIQALNSSDELQSGQIYFILPRSKLHYPLSASDMAALAVKASGAISSINGKRSSVTQISPLLIDSPAFSSSEGVRSMKKRSYSNKSTGGLGISRSVSMEKLQKYTSRRAKLAARSFRLRLSTIHEGSDLRFD